MAIVASPLDEDEIVFHILNGLGNDFKEISAAIRARESTISFDELHEKLIDYETYLKREPAAVHTPITANFASKPGSNTKSNNQNRGKSTNPFRGATSRQGQPSNNRYGNKNGQSSTTVVC